MIFTAIFLSLPTPLTAALILFINLATDVLPAIALGLEPTEYEIMNKKPRHAQQKILNKKFITRLIIVGVSMGIIVMGVYFWTLSKFGWSWSNPLSLTTAHYQQAISMAFVLLTMIQMANTLNARSEEKSIFNMNLLSNPKLLGAIALSILLSIIIVEVPLFQKYFHTVHLGMAEWLLLIVCSVAIIFIEEIRKFIIRKKNNTVNEAI